MEFEQLAAEYSNMIHHIIYSLHIYKNQDDFYQMGLIALWKGSQSFDEQKGTFKTYIYKFIKGSMLNELKKEHQWEERCFHPEDEDGFKQEYEDKTLELEYLLSHFHHLTELQKNWVVLRFYYGLSNRDIAAMKNISLRTVRSWGDTAMKKCIAHS